MTWALFINPSGKPEVDFYAFCRGKGLISEHATLQEARAAKLAYERQAEDEAKADLGQKELDFA